MSVGPADPPQQLVQQAKCVTADSRGLPAVQPLRSPAARSAGCIEDDILNFFKCYKCYELIPQSAKLVVLDTRYINCQKEPPLLLQSVVSRLTPKKAFLAMVETGVRACPLWDSGAGRLAGVLSLADLLALLHRSSSAGSSSLADNQVAAFCCLQRSG